MIKNKKKRLDKTVADIIRQRMVFLEGIAKNKKHIFSTYSMADARDSIKKLRKKYPHQWRTRKSYYIKYVAHSISEMVITKRK